MRLRRTLVMSLVAMGLLGWGLPIAEAGPAHDLGTPTVPAPPTSVPPTGVPPTSVPPTTTPRLPTLTPAPGSPTALVPTSGAGGSPTPGQPSVVPTGSPTSGGGSTPTPTRRPHRDPDPTEGPTEEPTQAPTDTPLGTPTGTELSLPSPEPTEAGVPTGSPTPGGVVPTGVPSAQPSVVPTGRPRPSPGAVPTRVVRVEGGRTPARLPVTAEGDEVPVLLALASLSPRLWLALVAVLIGIIGALVLLLTRRRGGKVVTSDAPAGVLALATGAAASWRLKPLPVGRPQLGAVLPPPLTPQPLPPLQPRQDLAAVLADALPEEG